MKLSFALIGAFACGLLPFHAARAEQITIGYMPITSMPEAVSEHLGLFKKYGIDAQLKLFQSGPAALQALLSGDVQMVDGGAVPMMNMATQGLPVYYLVSSGINTPEHPAGTIMIRRDETAIKSFADLKGRRVGQLGKGTNTYYWLWDATRKFGMKRDAFREIFVPFPDMGALLASKQVDAVYAWPPFDTLIAQAGQGKLLTDDSSWNPYSETGGTIVRRDWADKNPEVVKKLVEVEIERNRWIDDHPDEAREIIGKNLKLPKSVYQNMRTFYFPRNGYQLMPSIWDLYYLMLHTGGIQPLADPKAVIDAYWIKPAERFIAPALKDLGAQDDAIVAKAVQIKLQNLPKAPEAYFAPWEQAGTAMSSH